jgi:hypothetical protein
LPLIKIRETVLLTFDLFLMKINRKHLNLDCKNSKINEKCGIVGFQILEKIQHQRCHNFISISVLYLRAIINGTITITCKVVAALSPAAINPAYETAPRMPAAPVPEDQVDITFLGEKKNQL